MTKTNALMALYSGLECLEEHADEYETDDRVNLLADIKAARTVLSEMEATCSDK